MSSAPHSSMNTDSPRFTRRDFLKAGTVGGASLLVGFYFVELAREPKAAGKEFAPNAFVEIDPTGAVRLWVARSEMGQGVRTSMTMLLAEELDADWSRLELVQADFDAKYGDMITGGSASVRSSWNPLRKAGAAARDMLVTAAHQTWNVPKSECTTENGAVIHAKTKRQLSYGELAVKAAALPIPKDVPLKDPKDYRIVGTNKNRVDGPRIVVGETHYGIDTKIPGMQYAVVARPPVFGGRMKKFDPAGALAVAGVRKVVEVPPVEMPPLFGEERKENSGHQHFLWGGVAVIADSTWQAISGRKALTVEWEPGPGAQESTEKQRASCAEMVKGVGKEQSKIGDPEAALSRAAKIVEAEYELPFLSHTPMEPPNCTAHVHDGICEIWAPTQNAPGMATALASALGIPLSAIKIHVTLLGGGFGRRLNIDYGVEAALVSRAAGGVPVKVQWTREDDVRHDFYRPMSHHRLRAGLDAQNQIAAWLHHIAAPTTDGFYVGGDIPDTGGTEIAGQGLPNGTVPNYLLEASFLHTTMPRGYWRGVDQVWNQFAVQSFIDEVAAASGKDPLELRRELIATKQAPAASEDQKPVDVVRLRRVLDLAAEKSGWGKPLPKGRGRGIAGHSAWDTYIAQVAEVTVAKDGSIHVDRVVCAIDCGQVINPDMVTAQMEGGIVFGLTAALFGEVTVENGQTQQSNFNDYPMVRITDMPRIEVHIVPSHETPGGVGEPPVPSIAPAVANAIFAATGKRLRRLPFQTDKLAKS
ncbi:MAG: xanthine dehydrogenase family protein molybdopterin-binding subunit [Candidatus Acidiferrales bacterium]